LQEWAVASPCEAKTAEEPGRTAFNFGKRKFPYFLGTVDIQAIFMQYCLYSCTKGRKVQSNK